jgi:uncharacterized radical SAM superfamily protein
MTLEVVHCSLDCKHCGRTACRSAVRQQRGLRLLTTMLIRELHLPASVFRSSGLALPLGLSQSLR